MKCGSSGDGVHRNRDRDERHSTGYGHRDVIPGGELDVAPALNRHHAGASGRRGTPIGSRQGTLCTCGIWWPASCRSYCSQSMKRSFPMTLMRQRNHAAERDQTHLVDIDDRLLDQAQGGDEHRHGYAGDKPNLTGSPA